MVDLLAIVKRSVFEFDAEHDGHSPDHPGFTFGWKQWRPTGQSIVSRLKDGGRVWAVTVRPGQRLWLVAVYENPKVTYDDEDKKYSFQSRRGNRVRVIDITDLIPRISFENGTKITRKSGKLAEGLQTIRALSPASVKLLEARSGLAGGEMSAGRTGPAKGPDVSDSQKDPVAMEGERSLAEVMRRSRDPTMTKQRLLRDRHTCQHCGFSAASVGLDVKRPVLDVHHIYPLRDCDDKAETKITDLLTLCPTCHRVAHALEAKHKGKALDLKLLRSCYPVHRPDGSRRATTSSVAP